MAPTDRNFHVQADEAGQTLAARLRQWLPGKSWSQVERLVRTRHVLVDGNLCLDSARRLKAGEVVKVLEHPTAPLAREEDVLIRYLDPHLVVVEKPSGMTSVRHAEERHWPARRRQMQPTLEDLLPRIIAKRQSGRRGGQQKAARGPQPPGRGPSRTPPVRPVHRLDRETSGLMVFARTVEAERRLGEQFRRHAATRRYLAVVIGHIEAQTIESRLVRDRGDGRRGSTSQPGVGKRAVTHVEPVEPLGDYMLVECRLQTGRTHQIRIHLAERGHPVCGERVYTKPLAGKEMVDKSGAPRLALHAAELHFVHPITGEPMAFSMPLPGDLQQFIARLRGKPKPRSRPRT